MKNTLIILLFPTLLSADSIPYKNYCGECYTMVNDSTWVDGVWLPIPDEPELDIKPSTTVWKEAEKFIPRYHEPYAVTEQGIDWNIIVKWLFNIPVLVFSTLYFFLFKK